MYLVSFMTTDRKIFNAAHRSHKCQIPLTLFSLQKRFLFQTTFGCRKYHFHSLHWKLYNSSQYFRHWNRYLQSECCLSSELFRIYWINYQLEFSGFSFSLTSAYLYHIFARLLFFLVWIFLEVFTSMQSAGSQRRDVQGSIFSSLH